MHAKLFEGQESGNRNCGFVHVWDDDSGQRRIQASSSEGHALFFASSNAALSQVSGRCPKLHKHLHLLDGKAKVAAIHPPQLCRAIIKGIEEEKQRQGRAMTRHILHSLEHGCALNNMMPEGRPRSRRLWRLTPRRRGGIRLVQNRGSKMLLEEYFREALSLQHC